MPTLMQKIRLAFKGWKRRREEAEREFVKKNAGWSPAEPPSPAPTAKRHSPIANVDIDGLMVAFVDDSGVITYYLDSETGEVLDVRDGATYAAPRYRRVPRRNEASDAADRRAFVESRETPSEVLARAAASRDDFRRALGEDRSLERAWYNFKNDRILRAVDDWLRREGLR